MGKGRSIAAKFSLTPRFEPSVFLCPWRVHAPFWLIFELCERTVPVYSHVDIHIFLLFLCRFDEPALYFACRNIKLFPVGFIKMMFPDTRDRYTFPISR